MTPSLHIMLSLMVAEIVLGSVANGFIAVVNGIGWVQRQKISSVDGILVALAVSRIGLLWTVMVSECLAVLSPARYWGQTRVALNAAWVVTHHCSSWCATALVVFYFLKIAVFSSPTFLRLKRSVASVVVLMLWVMVAFLLVSVVVLYVGGVPRVGGCEGNATGRAEPRDPGLTIMALFSLMNLVPFLASLLCCLGLIYSLCRHRSRMKLQPAGSRDVGTAVHVKALQTVVSVLLLFTTYFLAIIAAIWRSRRPQSTRTELLFHSIGLLYPSGHSYILIWANRRLKQAFLWALGQAVLWLRDWKPLRP